MIESTVCGTSGSAPAGGRRPPFEVRQRHDADGALRVTLIGELDLAVTDRLRAQLDAIRRSGRRVRLDLSQLEFIDCRGVDGVLTALAEARRNRWHLEVDPRVSPSVMRIASLKDVSSALWPAPDPRPRVGAGPL